MSSVPSFVGIDVSKEHLDVAFRPVGEACRFPNTAEGVAALVVRLRAVSPALIVLEATGGLERLVGRVALVNTSFSGATGGTPPVSSICLGSG